MSLSTKQKRTIAALLSSRTTEDAAKAAGVCKKTVYRWLNDPVFAAALSEAEGQAINVATRRLVNLTDSAIDTLAAVLDDPSATTTHKLRAASTVLEAMLKLRELRQEVVFLIHFAGGGESVQAIRGTMAPRDAYEVAKQLHRTTLSA